jgi:hypothetical protein
MAMMGDSIGLSGVGLFHAWVVAGEVQGIDGIDGASAAASFPFEAKY